MQTQPELLGRRFSGWSATHVLKLSAGSFTELAARFEKCIKFPYFILIPVCARSYFELWRTSPVFTGILPILMKPTSLPDEKLF
jgi:hypothetical protein